MQGIKCEGGAESTGVTIYTVSTRETIGNKTDADKVLEALAERSGGEAMFSDVPRGYPHTGQFL